MTNRGLSCHLIVLCVSFLVFVLFSCSPDEINQRLDNIETEIQDLKAAVKALNDAYEGGKIIRDIKQIEDGQGGWIITFSDSTSISIRNGNDGDSFISSIKNNGQTVIITLSNGEVYAFSLVSNDVEPKLLSLKFLMKDNPLELLDDISSDIINDSTVNCWIRYVLIDKVLVPTIDYQGDSLVIHKHRYYPGEKIDLKTPVNITVLSGTKSKEYTIYVHSFTGLPVIWIETEGREDISSKEEYIKASFKLEENVLTKVAGDIIVDSIQIKGRGNSSWDYSPKKSFTLKFSKKVSLLNEPKDKTWLLIANYFDKSMLRNKAAFYLGDISQLDYTPRTHFVELFFNGRYHGTYALCEKIKISKDRVNVGDDGFVLEVDKRAIKENAVYFHTTHMKQPFNIKDPDVQIDDDKYLFIKEYVQHAEDVLFSESFKDPYEGWQKYMDIVSFVDWYLISEIGRNGDSMVDNSFYTSVYMNLTKGGKLKMGPLWDFDVAFGNNFTPDIYPTEGWFVRDVSWYTRLFEDPVFVQAVIDRFPFFYNNKSSLYNELNAYSQYLKYSVQENENRWGTLYNYTFPNRDIWGSYQNEVQYLKQWIDSRMEWMYANLSN